MTAPTFRIRRAESDGDVATIRALFVEYQRWLGVDLCFQGFEAELAGLPGRYAPPAGRLLIAEVEKGGGVAGCVGLWALGADVCEMKRLWVRPEFRGLGLGRRLAERIIATGHELGYATMRLDSLPHLTEAIALYRDLGFTDTAPYYDNPIEGVAYLELGLTA